MLSNFEKEPSDSGPMVELDEIVETQLQSHQPKPKDEDEYTLKFLDSLDNYMMLLDSLSSTLGQGWFQLASARHSMGASRINSSLLNLKPHNAVTRLQVTHDQADPITNQPQFTLCKWTSCGDGNSGETEDGDEMQKMFESLNTQDNSTSPSPVCAEPREKSLPTNLIDVDADKRVQTERFKSLAVFGTLVPPRLRDSQLSFEKALETLVEIANARSSMLSAFGQLQKDTRRSKES